MRKKIIVFVLCFCLIFCSSIKFDNNIKVVKANPAIALSFVALALTSMGVTYYYQSTNTTLAHDIEIYCQETNKDYSSWLNIFQNAVVDVGKKIVKYSAAQVYALKSFVNYLSNKNKVSDEPITSNSFKTVPLFGYPSLFEVHADDYIKFSFSSNSNENYYLHILSIGSGLQYAYVGFNLVTNYYSNSISVGGLVVAPSNGATAITYKWITPSGQSSSVYTASVGNSGVCPLLSSYFNKMGSSPFYYCYVNDRTFCNCYFNYQNFPSDVEKPYGYGKFLEACKLRFGFSSVSNKYTGVVLPSYSVDRSVFNTADDTKPLVVTVPKVIDKAVDIAIGRNPDAVAITVDDVAVAIDDTAIGVIDRDAEDEEDKVIAPDLTLPLDTTQDETIADSIVEDLAIGEPLPPPDPPEPPVIDVPDIGSKFPFSIFFDFVLLMELFDREPLAPAFNLGFNFLGNQYEFLIDLSVFDVLARILRLMELIAFIASLIFLTIKYIRGKE